MIAKSLSALLALGFLAACAGAQTAAPSDSFHRLETPQPQQVLASPIVPGVLEVGGFFGEGVLSDRALVYLESGQALKRYSYDLWNQPVAEMLEDRMANFLRAANAAPRITTPALRARPDFYLQGRVKRFEQVLDGTPGVVAEVEMSLSRADNGEVLMLETYEIRESAAGDSAQTAVQAFDRAVDQMFNRLLQDLVRTRVNA